MTALLAEAAARESTLLAVMVAAWLMVLAGLSKKQLDFRPRPPWQPGAVRRRLDRRRRRR